MSVTIPGQVSTAAKLVVREFNPNLAITEVVQAVREWKSVTEEEQTKRRTIRSQERIAVADIKARRTALVHYLDHSFDERKENFRRLFDNLDNAMDSDGDVAAVLAAITSLAATGPFAQLRDVQAFADFFADRNTVIEV